MFGGDALSIGAAIHGIAVIGGYIGGMDDIQVVCSGQPERETSKGCPKWMKDGVCVLGPGVRAWRQ